MDVNEELKFLGKFKKKFRGGGGSGWGVRVVVNEVLKKKKILGGGGGGLGWGEGKGGRGSVWM